MENVLRNMDSSSSWASTLNFNDDKPIFPNRDFSRIILLLTIDKKPDSYTHNSGIRVNKQSFQSNVKPKKELLFILKRLSDSLCTYFPMITKNWTTNIFSYTHIHAHSDEFIAYSSLIFLNLFQSGMLYVPFCWFARNISSKSFSYFVVALIQIKYLFGLFLLRYK